MKKYLALFALLFGLGSAYAHAAISIPDIVLKDPALIQEQLAADVVERVADRLENIRNMSERDIATNLLRSENEIVVKFKGHSGFQKVSVSGGETVDAMLARFQDRADVAYAEPNYIARAFAVPNDPLYQYQWHLDNPSSGGIGMEEAWDMSAGAGVTVAVIDTGVAYENYRKNRRNRYYLAPDLANTSFAAGYDFVENDTHPNDDNGHGTHVAGTIAQSTGNNTGTAGIAHAARIMPIKVLNKNGSGTYADIADAVRYAADHGAQVINMSLGGSAQASYLEEALAYAYGKGVVIVAAAGNSADSAVSYPAGYDDYVISVGATRFDETLAPYSSYGASVDVVAPGGDLSVDQNGDDYADGVLQQTFGSRMNDWGYYFYEGTSMATPHVAGTAALVIANGTATTPEEVRAAIETTAKDLGSSGRDNTYGNGLVNAPAALLWGGAVEPPPPPPPPENVLPAADAGPDASGYTGEAVFFDGSGSSDPDGSITLFDWDFGDGSSASGETPSHIYAAPGTYTATLTVTDNDGASDTDTAQITISDRPATPAMHIGDITFTYRQFGSRWPYCRVTAYVPVHDSGEAGIDDVSVTGAWSGAYDRSVSGTTRNGGVASFTTSYVRGCGTFTFTVTGASKNGWLYDGSANEETSDSITL